MLLLVVGLRHWLKRPRAGQPANLPKWLQAIENITPVKSGLLGVALSALNPKEPSHDGGRRSCHCQRANVDRWQGCRRSRLRPAAISTVVLPVVLFRILGARGQTILESLNAWLQANNALMTAVLIIVIGVVLMGKGIAGF